MIPILMCDKDQHWNSVRHLIAQIVLGPNPPPSAAKWS